MASKLYQVFSGVPNQKYCLVKARIVAKNGQLSDWTAWHYALAGDSTPPVVPTAAEVDSSSPIGAMFFRLTDAYIAAMDADIVRFRWYVQSRSGSGALAFDSAWTPTAITDRDTYTYTYSVAYAAATYYHIWCIPEDVMGNWDSTPGAAQEQNKQPGYVATTDVPVSSLGWTYSGAFTASDADTVAWAAGSLVLADGNTYSITGSNSGNMSAVTYIYWDKDVSTTAFQTTTTAATSVGANKLLIAVAKNETGKNATFQAFNAKGGGVLITADNITAGTITGNEVAANTIAAGNLTVATLSAITANMGTLTAGTITGGKYNTATSGARVQLFPDANTGIVAYDDGGGSEKKVFEVLVAGTDVGDVIIGDSTGQYLKYDKSAGTITANLRSITLEGTNVDFFAQLSSSQGSFGVADETGSLVLGYTNNDATNRWGLLYLFKNVISPGSVTGTYITLNANLAQLALNEDSGGAGEVRLYSTGVMNLEGPSVSIVSSSGDILIDPAGGDVDFDACNICVDAGKKVMLEGVAGDTYMVFNSGAAQIEFYINGTLAGHVDLATGFVDD